MKNIDVSYRVDEVIDYLYYNSLTIVTKYSYLLFYKCGDNSKGSIPFRKHLYFTSWSILYRCRTTYISAQHTSVTDLLGKLTYKILLKCTLPGLMCLLLFNVLEWLLIEYIKWGLCTPFYVVQDDYKWHTASHFIISWSDCFQFNHFQFSNYFWRLYSCFSAQNGHDYRRVVKHHSCIHLYIVKWISETFNTHWQ